MQVGTTKPRIPLILQKFRKKRQQLQSPYSFHPVSETNRAPLPQNRFKPLKCLIHLPGWGIFRAKQRQFFNGN